ncbi:TNNI1 [Branchiostoma lanceolatum]|uniref:TNNI1 protein n=1 Tax=Branchiostoma lanceolatum TaxID=7740 RepID=A0A8K0AAQ5_BRALA|nr:TNNI1 [Branchiostoma lanceolatum]
MGIRSSMIEFEKMNADDRERRREERRRRRQIDEAEESSPQAEASAAPTVDPDEERRLARERRRKEREAANAAAEEESRKMQEELEARRMRRRKMRDGVDENQDDSDRVSQETIVKVEVCFAPEQRKLEEEAKKKEEEEEARRQAEEEERRKEEERKQKEEEKRQREEEKRRQREEEEEEERRREQEEEEEEKRRQEEEEELRREEEKEKEREMEARRKKAEMRKREEESRKAEQPKVKQEESEQPMVKRRPHSPAEEMGDENSGPPPEKTEEKASLSSFKSKLSAGRKLNIKVTLMLKKAKEDLAQEAADRESAKRKFLEDVLPPLKLGGLSQDALESLCRDLHAQIEQAEEERFEAEYKVKKNDQEIEDLNMRIMSFTGRFKKPELKKVKVTPENMLNSLAESRRTKPGIIDFRANLKHVEREGHDSRRGSSSTTKSEGMEENLNGEED